MRRFLFSRVLAMYLEYFGFREVPFSIAPDPRYLYMSERHREALAHLLYGIRSDCGFVLLTGEVGTGKTTICRSLLEQVPEDTEIAFVLHPKVTALELLATICDELAIPYPKYCISIKDFIDRINSRLLANYAANRRTVLIIDEAQNLHADVLEQIRLLTNLETNERKLLQIIMLGQPELRVKLSRPELRQLAQRITARYHLEALSRRETAEYIQHRLGVGGVRRRLFTKPALHQIHRLSEGVPRRINVLSDRALLGAYVQGREKVGIRTVRRAAREVFDLRTSPFHWKWSAAAVLLISSGLAPSYLHNGPPPPSVEAAPVPEAAVTPPALPATLSWPANEALGDSRRMAFENLFQLWNLGHVGDAPCAEAKRQGLACLEGLGSLETVLRFNLPAILSLHSEGKAFSALLMGREGNNGTFSIGSSTATVPLSSLETIWSGEYILLWRQPPFEETLVKPGDGGAAVGWLAERLAVALDYPPLAKLNPVLEGELLAHLKRFQFSQGLIPDGVVGPHTLIFLEAASGQGGPFLALPQEAI